MNALWRGTFIVLLLASIPLYVLQYTLVPKAGTFGLQTDYQFANGPSITLHVMSVDAASPAWESGIRTGDEIPLSRNTRETRIALWAPLPGDHVTVTYSRRGGLRRANMVAKALPPYHFALPDVVRTIVTLCIFMFAFLVAARAWHTGNGPLIATILTGLVVNAATDQIPWVAHGGVTAFLLLGNYSLTTTAQMLQGLLTVVLAGRLIGGRSQSLRLLVYGFDAIAAAVILYIPYGFLSALNGSAGAFFEIVFDWLYATLPLGLVALGMLIAYSAGRGEHRQRIGWIFWGFFPFSVGLFLLNLSSFVPILSKAVYSSPQTALIISSAVRLIELSLPISLFYGVLVRRAVDIGFVVNRIAIYSVLSVLLVSIFVLLEYAASHLFLESGRAGSLTAQLAIALIIGFSARFLHTFVDRFVDRVLFAKRHADESALRRFAREAEAYTSSDALLDRTVAIVRAHSEARGVTIYTMGNGGAQLARTSSDGIARTIEMDDPLLVSLRRWNEPVDTHDVATAFADGMVFPITARGKILGALACETKEDLSAFAPDERESLSEVARGVGSALDALGHANPQDTMLEAIGKLLDAKLGAMSGRPAQ